MTGVLLKKFQEVARDLPLRFSQAATGVAYDDTILTLTSASTPDPFVVRSGDNYYLVREQPSASLDEIHLEGANDDVLSSSRPTRRETASRYGVPTTYST